MPARLKGYIDRVFCHGFAYTLGETGVVGLLKGKKVMLISTTGVPEEMYPQSGMYKSLAQTIDDGIFTFSGMEVVGHKYFGAVPYTTDEGRKAMLEKVKNIAAALTSQG